MVIVSVPWCDTNFALMAPASLKPVVEKAGLSCLAVDINGEVVAKVKKQPNQHEILRFFFENKITPEAAQWTFDMLLGMVKQILSFTPQWVGISTFSYLSKNTMTWLAYLLKKFDPSVKIVVGGPGCLENNFVGPATFTQKLIDHGFVDYHIRGDGEHALYNLLTGHDDFPGVNDEYWQQLTREELTNLPMPDYSDYDFSIYEKKMLGILGSRGCVRKCKFCDYIENWKKFTWRNGQDVYEEMLTQHRKYGIKHFKFQDSLVNGNLKEFTHFTTQLSAFNQQRSDDRLKWTGFYIFREWTSNSEREWQLLHDGGAKVLNVGIENLNEHIRYDMGKKFSNASIDRHLEQARKYKIFLVFLMIVGWHTETYQDIEFAKQWLDAHIEYKDTLAISWGGTLGIFTDTYLDRNKDKLGIRMIGNTPQHWQNHHSNPEIRVQWVKELEQHSINLGYTTIQRMDNHYLLEMLANA
jgi:hypothetical protein